MTNKQATDASPQVWPECSTCETAYVLRRCITFGKNKWEWLWQRDCKHKSEPRVGRGGSVTGVGGCSSRAGESADFPWPAGGLSGALLEVGGSGSQLIPQPPASSHFGSDGAEE